MAKMNIYSDDCLSRIEGITLLWFLSEPVLFSVYCMHTFIENTAIDVPFRSGQLRIEYNPFIIQTLDDTQLEYFFRCELIRIMFGLPYQKKSNEKGSIDSLRPDTPCDSGLWDDDESSHASIAKSIEQVKDWGTESASFKEQIQIEASASINFRTALRQFRASVISNKRCLTRMKPNRRTDFSYMGSKYTFSTRLLAAVDTSGSIGTKDISNFYSIIGKFFAYGIDSIDVIMFDRELQGKPVTLRNATSNITVAGRGGTSYTPLFEFVQQQKNISYDGVLIFTDGDARTPQIPADFKKKHQVLWICNTKSSFDEHRKWMQKSGSVCFIH